jgi:hypothetical protein
MDVYLHGRFTSLFLLFAFIDGSGWICSAFSYFTAWGLNVGWRFHWFTIYLYLA